jgi:hypothetical protein
MSQPAKDYQPSTWQVLNLPIEELRRLETEGPKPKPFIRTIDTAKLTADSQLALISICGHPICRVMTETMRTTHCTCGWRTRLYSRKFGAGTDHAYRVQRHLAQAADAIRPRVDTP